MSIERIFQQERDRSCLSKRRYKSEAQADLQAGVVARRTGTEMERYHCLWCKGWHLTKAKEADDGEDTAGRDQAVRR